MNRLIYFLIFTLVALQSSAQDKLVKIGCVQHDQICYSVIVDNLSDDAASDSIHIKTDDDGKVVEASNKSCE